jgi:hypothetical protein
MEAKQATKSNSQVWVRWFFVSNFGDQPMALERENLYQQIYDRLNFYADEFWEKAEFAIYDGNEYRVVSAKEVKDAQR